MTGIEDALAHIYQGGLVRDQVLRDQLLAQLEGGQAYMPVAAIIREFNWEDAGRKPIGIRHTPWQLLEHLRISQWDILRFTLDPDHESPKWPDEYWPEEDVPFNEAHWHRSVETFFEELEQVKTLARDPATNLFSQIPHGTGQTILREILLVADHNAYHLGQFLMIRRALESD